MRWAGEIASIVSKDVISDFSNRNTAVFIRANSVSATGAGFASPGETVGGFCAPAADNTKKAAEKRKTDEHFVFAFPQAPQTKIFENNKLQEIPNFARETDLSITVTLAIDTGTSMPDKLKYER